ncbi:MAG: hypothetical protein ACR2OZ_15985 [Verrucomicrobiales bacterium]
MRKLFFILLLSATGAHLRADGSLEVGAFKFTPPSPWQVSKSPKPMSQGGFVLPGKEGVAELEAAFYHFGPGQGGDIEGNIKRWQGMFQADPAPKVAREETAFGDKKATLVVIAGTYKGSSFRPEPSPKPDHTLIAAILPSDRGDVFVRMVGPTASVTAAKEDFKKLLASGAPAK